VKETCTTRSAAYEKSIIENLEEEDPLFASLEAVHFLEDVKKLKAQEEQVMNAECRVYLDTERSTKESTPEEEKSTPQGRAESRAAQHALQQYIEKVMLAAADKTTRANEADSRRLAFEAALERWREWKEEKGETTQNIPSCCGVDEMEATRGRNYEYYGLGYGTTKKQFDYLQFEDSDFQRGFRSCTTSNSRRREAKRQLREAELQEGAEDLVLAVQRQPHLDSRVVKFEAMEAIVDSGSTVSLSDLAGGTVLYDYDADAKVRVKAFNNSHSKGQGRGTIIGWGTDVKGERVPFRVPRVHRLDGSTVNLLSVSSLAAMGNEFHFTKRRSWMTTPSGHEVNFEQNGGLYWLRWKRAVDISANSDGDYRHTSADSNEALRDLAREACHYEDCETCSLARGQHRPLPLSLLHRRCGHWNDELLVKMVKSGAIDVALGNKTPCVCDICRLCKPTRRPVGASREHESDTEAPFERVWTDLKGAVTPDFEGNRYVVTFSCEMTR